MLVSADPTSKELLTVDDDDNDNDDVYTQDEEDDDDEDADEADIPPHILQQSMQSHQAQQAQQNQNQQGQQSEQSRKFQETTLQRQQAQQARQMKSQMSPQEQAVYAQNLLAQQQHQKLMERQQMQKMLPEPPHNSDRDVKAVYEALKDDTSGKLAQLRAQILKTWHPNQCTKSGRPVDPPTAYACFKEVCHSIKCFSFFCGSVTVFVFSQFWLSLHPGTTAGNVQIIWRKLPEALKKPFDAIAAGFELSYKECKPLWRSADNFEHRFTVVKNLKGRMVDAAEIYQVLQQIQALDPRTLSRNYPQLYPPVHLAMYFLGHVCALILVVLCRLEALSVTAQMTKAMTCR